jgi:hypothetical protein
VVQDVVFEGKTLGAVAALEIFYPALGCYVKALSSNFDIQREFPNAIKVKIIPSAKDYKNLTVTVATPGLLDKAEKALEVKVHAGIDELRAALLAKLKLPRGINCEIQRKVDPSEMEAGGPGAARDGLWRSVFKDADGMWQTLLSDEDTKQLHSLGHVHTFRMRGTDLSTDTDAPLGTVSTTDTAHLAPGCWIGVPDKTPFTNWQEEHADGTRPHYTGTTYFRDPFEGKVIIWLSLVTC